MMSAKSVDAATLLPTIEVMRPEAVLIVKEVLGPDQSRDAVSTGRGSRPLGTGGDEANLVVEGHGRVV